jgi:hypothetical protein
MTCTECHCTFWRLETTVMHEYATIVTPPSPLAHDLLCPTDDVRRQSGHVATE